MTGVRTTIGALSLALIAGGTSVAFAQLQPPEVGACGARRFPR